MNTKEKNLEEDDSEEQILEEKNFQEMIKNFWENYKKTGYGLNIKRFKR